MNLPDAGLDVSIRSTAWCMRSKRTRSGSWLADTTIKSGPTWKERLCREAVAFRSHKVHYVKWLLLPAWGFAGGPLQQHNGALFDIALLHAGFIGLGSSALTLSLRERVREKANPPISPDKAGELFIRLWNQLTNFIILWASLSSVPP
jgi:hypothetical protein